MSKGTLQTLERGIQVVGFVAEAANGLTMAQIAQKLGTHRTIAYRIVATLEEHGLVSRPGDNRVYLGSGVLTLANSYLPQIRRIAQPVLAELATETDTTAFLAVAQGDAFSVIASADANTGGLQIGYRIGGSHPIHQSAVGITILAGRPPVPGEPEAVSDARAKGYSLTTGQLHPGATGLACPLFTGALEASVGIVTMGDLDGDRCAAIVKRHVAELAQRLAPETDP
ncbi:MAG: IclR family transcriptional regulator [Rhodobacter sp.]|nr:IclR family transcriptional regulator [Paracoccaceae bacterium]MCC0075127.1 IclR family transcriptional regulator [Rhodobacter sp.]